MKAWSSKPITIWLGGSRHPVAFFEGIRRVCAASRPDCSLDGVRLLAEVCFNIKFIRENLGDAQMCLPFTHLCRS